MYVIVDVTIRFSSGMSFRCAVVSARLGHAFLSLANHSGPCHHKWLSIKPLITMPRDNSSAGFDLPGT